jgi:hypothetical protein
MNWCPTPETILAVSSKLSSRRPVNLIGKMPVLLRTGDIDGCKGGASSRRGGY